MFRYLLPLLLAQPQTPPAIILPGMGSAPPPIIIPQRLPVLPVVPQFKVVTKRVAVQVPRGDHVHHCPCGNEWSHSTGNPGHVCQNCGRTVTAISRHGPTAIMKMVQERVQVEAPVPAQAPMNSTPGLLLMNSIGSWVGPSSVSYSQPNCPT